MTKNKSNQYVNIRKGNKMKKGDKLFELICITSPEYNPNEEIEISLGFYSSYIIAVREKKICEKQAEEDNQDLKYEVKKHKIII